MAEKRIGRRTIEFASPPAVAGFASVVCKKEGEGPLSGTFDIISSDPLFGEKTWEKAESRMQKTAFMKALEKAALSRTGIDVIFGGDLLNQCIGTGFSVREFGVPFMGLYGACSTMAEGLISAAMAIDGGFAVNAAAITSSHFCTAERQYRFPLEYGGQRTPTAQWTATAAGAVILSEKPGRAVLTKAAIGRIVDLEIRDANNMGAAMAPAAYDTLSALFEDTGTCPSDYDLIITGDLATVGTRILRDMFKADGVDITSHHDDCGMMLFDGTQDVHAGASGCGCSAAVLCGYILRSLEERLLKKVIFAGTGALLSPTSMQQGESIPGICHAVCIEAR